jgi:cytochrome c oxidase subunit 2
VRRKPFAAVLAVGLALALAGIAHAGTGLKPVPPASPNAEEIETTYWMLVGVAAAIFVLVEGALVLFVVRYRRAGRPRDQEAPQVHGHTRLELIWTAIPVLILAVIATVVFWELPGIKNVPSASAGGGTLEVEVESRQFYWQYTYPDGTITYDTLVVPVGRVVELAVTSPPYDVIHSWWIPALGGKVDAIPGQTNHTWFRATKAGEYLGQCAEFCGLQHSAMLASVRAVASAEFDSVLGASREQAGQAAFEGVCAKCHNLSGDQLIGPNLEGNSTLADHDALRAILENGQGRMPAVGRGWSDDQFDALFEYVSREVAPSGS